ncbi:MAG: glucodextranase DOMON-like domain-containing protein [Fusobacteriota bacterium]
MKKLLLVSTMVAGLLLAGGCGKTAGTSDGEAKLAPGVIVNETDVMGDDNGPGTYVYPTDKVFVPGAFDLTGVKVEDGGETYDITLTIATDFKDDWGNPAGWDVQMFDVYFNLGEGKNNQAIAGRHVKIEEGWDRAVLIGPDKPTRMRKEIDDKNVDVADDVSDFETLVDDIVLPDQITTMGNTMTVKVAKSKIGNLEENFNGIQVFMTGSEGYPTKTDTYNRVVNEYAAQWRFGGGSDYLGDPNVMDILGDNSKLANYKSDEGVSEYATVNLVK